MELSAPQLPLIPAQAGTQRVHLLGWRLMGNRSAQVDWVPACAGMSG